MPRLDVCLETLLTDRSYPERIRAARRCGLDAVEFWFPDVSFGPEGPVPVPKDADGIREALAETGVEVSNMVLNAPEGTHGGAPVNPADRKMILDRLRESLDFARKLDCSRLIVCAGNAMPAAARESQREAMVTTLREAAALAESEGAVLLLEPLNTTVDHPGYFLDSADEAAGVVREVASPALRLLYDLYHMQIMGGNLLAFVEANLDIIGHFHAAGVPGRHELYASEVDYRFITRRLDELGYAGFFGLEYYPAAADGEESLRSVVAHLTGGAETPGRETIVR